MKIPYDLVLIEWKDHWSEENWVARKDVQTEPEKCLSIGWLVKEDDESVVIVSCLDPADFHGGVMGGVWTIMKNCVVTRKILKKRYEKKVHTVLRKMD